MQPEQPIAVPFEAPVEKKKGSGSIIAMVGLGILAVAGIGFGIYGLMKEPEVKVETKVEPKVSREAATNILKPYIGLVYNPAVDISNGFSDGDKIIFASHSALLHTKYDSASGGQIYNYRELDYYYHNLFGEHLEKKTVAADYGITFTYDSGRDIFIETGSGFGGPSPDYVPVTSVKEAKLDDDSLSVVVYYDFVPSCEYLERIENRNETNARRIVRTK